MEIFGTPKIILLGYQRTADKFRDTSTKFTLADAFDSRFLDKNHELSKQDWKTLDGFEWPNYFTAKTT